MKKILILLLLSVKLFSFEIGEKLTYELSYGVITAGESTIKVTETTYRDTIKCLEISSISKTNSFFDKIYKVRDKIESIWSLKENCSYKYSKNLKEGKYRQSRTHFYYPEQKFSIYLKKVKKTAEYKEKKMSIPENTHDILSGFYWMRMQKMVVGNTIFANVTVGGKNYVAGVKVLRLETIDSILGQKECFVLEPVLEGESIFKQTGKIYIWVTNDENKIPLKLESKIIFGHFRSILKKVSNVKS